jgi:hypothetical protein
MKLSRCRIALRFRSSRQMPSKARPSIFTKPHFIKGEADADLQSPNQRRFDVGFGALVRFGARRSKSAHINHRACAIAQFAKRRASLRIRHSLRYSG